MIVLLSGGLDSVAAWRLLGLPHAIHFDIGTRSVPRERKALEWASSHFSTDILYRHLPMGDYESDNGFLPFRNALLILAAAQLDPHVVIGQVAEWAPDKNARFYRRLEKTVNVARELAEFAGRLIITAPFAHLSKGELLAEYDREFGAKETALLAEHTWSCYRDERHHCGRCGGCTQRWNAEAQFGELMGVSLSTRYQGVPGDLTIPLPDLVRWITDNGWLGVRQLAAHRRQTLAGRRAHLA